MSGDGDDGEDNGVAGNGSNLKGAVMKGRPDRVTPAGRVHLGPKGGTAGPVVTVAAATGRTRAAPVATAATRAQGIRMRPTPTRKAVTAGLAMRAALEARTAWMPATAGPMGMVAVAKTAFAQVTAGKMVTAPTAAAGTTVATRVPVGMEVTAVRATPRGGREWRRCGRRRHGCRGGATAALPGRRVRRRRR